MLDYEISLWDNENNTEKLHSSESESYTCYILMYSQYIVSFTDTSVHFTVTCSVNILYTWIGFVRTVLKSDLVSKFNLKVILQMIRLQFCLKPLSQTIAKLVFYANLFL